MILIRCYYLVSKKLLPFFQIRHAIMLHKTVFTLKVLKSTSTCTFYRTISGAEGEFLVKKSGFGKELGESLV